MNKKIIIIFSILILIIAILMIFRFIKKETVGEIPSNETSSGKPTVQFDENTGYYYVRDTKTGEIRGASQDEAELKIYIDNPDYDPDPFTRSPSDLNEYIQARGSQDGLELNVSN